MLSLAAAIVTAAAEEEGEWRKAARKKAAKKPSSSSSSSHQPPRPPQPGPPPSPALAAAIRALGAAPARRLTPVAVRVSTMAWAWVAAAAPGLRVPLAAAVAAGWSSTQDAHAGLFSRSTLFDAETFHMSPGGDPDDHPELTRGVKAHAAWLEYWSELWFSVCADGGRVGSVGGVPPSSASSSASAAPSPSNFTAAVSADAQAIRSLLSRLLHRALENARHLTQHPASGGARARLARLALLLAKSELRAAKRYCPSCPTGLSSSSSPAAAAAAAAAAAVTSASVRASNARLLAQRALRASLLWFEGPPAWYGRWTPDEAGEQVSAAAELAALVGDGRWFVDDDEVAGSAGEIKRKKKVSAPSPCAATAASATAAAAAAPDPVWGRCPGATPEQRVSLLKLLLDAEVERTAAWARPLAVPSHPRSPYARFRDAQWRDLVRAAWAVSPKLALSLPERLPECAAVERALEELVVAHAGEPELQAVPRGAAILANCVSTAAAAASAGGKKKKPPSSSSSSLLFSACVCGGGGVFSGDGGSPLSSSSSSSPSALDPFRSSSPTDALALWAPAPLLQALAMLGGQAGGVPAVRAYALRSLEGCDPEQVSFLLLVGLRGGEIGWRGGGGEEEEEREKEIVFFFNPSQKNLKKKKNRSPSSSRSWSSSSAPTTAAKSAPTSSQPRPAPSSTPTCSSAP